MAVNISLANPISACIEIEVQDIGLWNIPQEYLNTIDPYVQASALWCPWPIDILPRQGDEINFSRTIQFTDLVAKSARHSYSVKYGYKIIVPVQSKDDIKIDLRELLNLAQESFHFFAEWEKSIKEILQEAKLPLTWEEFESVKKV